MAGFSYSPHVRTKYTIAAGSGHQQFIAKAVQEVKEDLTVLVLGPREFGGILEEVPGIAVQIMANLARRIRTLDDKIYP